MITPPVGMNVYIVKGAAETNVTLDEIFAGIWPFVLCDVIVLFFLIMFPKITLFLPSLLG